MRTKRMEISNIAGNIASGFSSEIRHLGCSYCRRSCCVAICPRSVPSLWLCHCSGTKDRQNTPTVSCERTLPPLFYCGATTFALAIDENLVRPDATVLSQEDRP